MALHPHKGEQLSRLRRLLATEGAVDVPGASPVTPGKARKMLRHGTVHGKPLSSKQEGLFGLIAGGGSPSRARGFRG